MATLFIDYAMLVRQVYEQKQADNSLPYGLMHLTPAKLKEECVMRCGKNLSRRDEKVIRVFCGDLNESKTCQVIVQHCDTDKFKPLVNFLKGKSEQTDPKNIELLAWLIDFPGRPWELGKTYSAEMDGNPEPTNFDLPANETDMSAGSPAIPENPIIQIDNQTLNKDEGTTDREKVRRKPGEKLALAAMLSLVIGSSGMLWWKEKNRAPEPSGGCMYWMEDHYEPVACTRKIPNAMVIALDSMKLKHFKKITTPDTITYMALGRVWYSKIDGKIEYYTSGGVHPVVFDHRLKPITIYIIDKYIRPGMSTE